MTSAPYHNKFVLQVSNSAGFAAEWASQSVLIIP